MAVKLSWRGAIPCTAAAWAMNEGEDGVQVRLEINGAAHELDVEPARRLVDVLRHDLGLTGTKESCAVGVCGACSVLVDGRLVSACLLPAALADVPKVRAVLDRIEAFRVAAQVPAGVAGGSGRGVVHATASP